MASDKAWDKLLKIETIGLDENSIDDHHYRYEPTPYPVLEKLADCAFMRKGTRCWTMVAVKGGSASSLRIRRRQKPSALSMTSESIA